MSQERSFRKTSGDVGSVWDPRATEKNGFAYDATNDGNNIMDGYLVEVKHGVGQNNSTVWNIHEVNADGTLGEKWAVWGDAVLNSELEKEKLGSFVRLHYKGKKTKKGQASLTQAQWSKSNTFHMWEVFVDDNAMPYNEANPGATIKQVEKPAATQQAAVGKTTPPAQFNSRQKAQPQAEATEFGDDLPF